MPLIKVLIPGQWWHDLTYSSPCPVQAGRRVLVPMGAGRRVGLCLGEESGSVLSADIVVRDIEAVLDASPVLPGSYARAARVTANAFLCSAGAVLRALLPSGFWREREFPAYPFCDAARESGTRFIYRYDDEQRLQTYRELAAGKEGGALVLFPERECAKRFYRSLVGVVPKERLFLWPASGTENAVKMWKKVSAAVSPVVVGGPGASVAPLDGRGTVILDEEAEPAWRAKAYPVFSLRSFAAARARESGADLVLGGRMPSSRVYSGFAPDEPKMPRQTRAAVRLIDIRKASRLNFKGVEFPLPVADSVIDLTTRLTGEGRVVFWLLDRRGLGSELHCADCGRVFPCPRCGAALALENGALRCPVCGARAAAPAVCPSCGGMLLQGASAGLESLAPMARSLLGDRPVVLWHAGNPANAAEAKKRTALLKAGGGLLLGSRGALSLLDEISPGMIVWLDADAEARQPHYASRCAAYSMLLESLWRGGAEREVVLQVRSDSPHWIRGLSEGWGYFWRRELADRRELGFPPYSHLVELRVRASGVSLISDLERAGFFVARERAASLKATVMTPRMPALRRFLEKYFVINRARLGFPSLEVWPD